MRLRASRATTSRPAARSAAAAASPEAPAPITMTSWLSWRDMCGSIPSRLNPRCRRLLRHRASEMPSRSVVQGTEGVHRATEDDVPQRQLPRNGLPQWGVEPQSHVRLHVAATAPVVRTIGSDGPPAVHRTEQGPGVGQAPPPAPGRTRFPRRAGLVPRDGGAATAGSQSGSDRRWQPAPPHAPPPVPRTHGQLLCAPSPPVVLRGQPPSVWPNWASFSGAPSFTGLSVPAPVVVRPLAEP